MVIKKWSKFTSVFVNYVDNRKKHLRGPDKYDKIKSNNS